MGMFSGNLDPKYQLLDEPKKKCNFCSITHWWVKLGLIVLTITILIISTVLIWDKVQALRRKTEELDFVLFGPKRESSDIVRISEHRALMYALANTTVTDVLRTDKSPVTLETYKHVNKPYKLVCYYVTPERSAPINQLQPRDIDATMCTHLIVAFATLRNNQIYLSNREIIDEVVSLKDQNPGLKILISVVSFSLEDTFGSMVANQSSRKEFIDSAIAIMDTHSLDGVDIDWEFPAWPVNKNASQKYGLTYLLKEMRAAFKDQYLITVAVAAPFVIVDTSYQVDELARYVDFVNIMCYDYHSFVWYLPITGFNSPLYADSSDSGYMATLNVNFTTNYWIKKGMPKEKIVIGIPLYGHSWTLDDVTQTGLNAPTVGFGSIGDKGFVSYRDARRFVADADTTVVFDGNARVPYAYRGREWFSYEDLESVSYKTEYITEMGLAGAMVFSLNQDDYFGSNYESNGRFPLVNRIKTVLVDDNFKRHHQRPASDGRICARTSYHNIAVHT